MPGVGARGVGRRIALSNASVAGTRPSGHEPFYPARPFGEKSSRDGLAASASVASGPFRARSSSERAGRGDGGAGAF